jgi:solute carrier family 26 (sodium-independent sulfate anion transporter), member 11
VRAPDSRVLCAFAGAIPSGVPVPQPPPFSYVRADNTTAGFLDMVSELGSGIIVIPLILLLEDIAICKAFSDGRTIDATQEMIAMGLASIGNSFLQAYPGGASLARSVIANGSGVKTTFNGIYTGKYGRPSRPPPLLVAPLAPLTSQSRLFQV